MVCKRLLISGKVQGVGFRFHAADLGAKLKLKGWIKNLDDGRVEVVLAGQPDSVDKMVAWFHKGPPTADVQKVEITNENNDIPKEDFFIKRETR